MTPFKCHKCGEIDHASDQHECKKIPLENVYVCEYGCLNVTVDVDVGVTPFMIKCVRRSTPERPLIPNLTGPDGECIGTATSALYPMAARPPHLQEPTHEWYKPEDLAILPPEEAAHVKQGGLLMRPRTKAEPLYHKEKLK